MRRASIPLALTALLAATTAKASCLGEPRSQAVVARVIDGETLALADGRELRLAASLAPRAIDAGAAAGTWPPEEQAKTILAAIALGRTVTLYGGEGPGGERDRFGRIVMHAVVSDEAGTPLWIQSEMVRRGFARVYRSRPEEPCIEALLQIEDDARFAKIGLWADPHYTARHPNDAQSSQSREGRFGHIAGTIARTFRTRHGQFMSIDGSNADRRSARGAWIFIRHGDPQLSNLMANRKRSLRGLHIEARGWFVRRSGLPALSLDVTEGGYIRQIERDHFTALDQAPAQKGTSLTDAAAPVPSRDGEVALDGAPKEIDAGARVSAQGSNAKTPKP